ncbi:aminotransferase class I/II-fold pyridoxal phosphate-dependent enzyme [bacterium]|nr:aminotransferase class I/II-fold pyridoxal phosphate-dependent enzyme [bacterium]
MKFADRRFQIDSSGIRKVFDLAATLENPCNLSIGQPDYDVPDAVKDAAIDAIRSGKNRYTLTAGTVPLREKVSDLYKQRGHDGGGVIVVAGTSGGLLLSLLVLLNPGDEIMFTDPYFVMYKHLAKFIGAVPRYINTYPDFRLRREELEKAWTPKCKMIIVNSPNNPTGIVYSREELEMVGKFAEEKDLIVLSDEIYEHLTYDGEFESPAKYTDPERTIIVSGLSKSAGMTGWRLGWTYGPKDLIQAMSEVQQYSFVCAPSPAQEAALVGIDLDMTETRRQYRGRRDVIYEGLSGLGYEVSKPGGAFYIFPKSPTGNGKEFVKEAIKNNLLVVPGNVFSEQNTHFRISFAVTEEQLKRGIGILGGMLAK